MIGQAVVRWAIHARVFAICWAVVVLSSTTLLGEDALLSRFRQEAPSQWRKYRELAAHSAGDCKATYRTAREGTTEVTEEEYSFIVDGKSARVIEVCRP